MSNDSERKRQREREENWKILQRKVSGTSAVTITKSTENQFYNFSFPPKPNDEEFDEPKHEEHHDVIHPDMVTNYNNRSTCQF